ncbi:MAG: hypothetical protein ACRDK3_05320 [Actinomycetota bacterium]
MDHHREHPAKGIQPDDGFEEGQRVSPRDADDEAEPRFSRGQEKTGLTPEKVKHEDFARGQDSDVPTVERSGRDVSARVRRSFPTPTAKAQFAPLGPAAHSLALRAFWCTAIDRCGRSVEA